MNEYWCAINNHWLYYHRRIISKRESQGDMIRLLECGVFTRNIDSHGNISDEEQADIDEEDPEKGWPVYINIWLLLAKKKPIRYRQMVLSRFFTALTITSTIYRSLLSPLVTVIRSHWFSRHTGPPVRNPWAAPNIMYTVIISEVCSAKLKCNMKPPTTTAIPTQALATSPLHRSHLMMKA